MPEYVNWLRHASPYINAHRDCTFVVMLPGDGVEHPNFGNIVHDIVLLHSLGVRLVLVHGSRPQIETRLAARGLTPHYHHGMRITDAATLECVIDAVGQLRIAIEARLVDGHGFVADAGLALARGQRQPRDRAADRRARRCRLSPHRRSAPGRPQRHQPPARRALDRAAVAVGLLADR